MSGESTVLSVQSDRGPVEAAESVPAQAVFEALADPDCRCIIRAVAEVPLTANECVRACDIPLSTTYRKLEMLAAAGFVEEGLRIRRDGKHASEYRQRFDRVDVVVDDEGELDVTVSSRTGPLTP